MIPFRKKDRGVAQIIIKRLSGSDEYDKMKDSNELGPEKLMYAKKTMSEYGDGMDQCCHDMIAAFEQKDSKMLKHALKNFVKMALKEDEQEEELRESSEY